MTNQTTETVPIPSPENPFRSVGWIAEALGITKGTASKYCREGTIKAYKDIAADEWRVLHSDFVEYCQKRYGAK
jgi:predicted site-specific integrase-resolvase